MKKRSWRKMAKDYGRKNNKYQIIGAIAAMVSMTCLYRAGSYRILQLISDDYATTDGEQK